MGFKFNPLTGSLDLASSGGQTWQIDQAPQESPNGATTTFTLPGSDTYVPGYIVVSLNGMLQSHTDDFTEISTTQIQFVTAPLSSDRIRLIYRTA